MSSARLTPESKATLRKTVRELRDVLLRNVREYAEQRYLLKVPSEKAKGSLSRPMRERRRRLDSALDERAAEEGGKAEARERALVNAVKESGATFLNRLVLIRHLEAVGLSRPAVVTGGWKSSGYQQFREFAPGLLEDDTQGYAVLLQLLFDELAADLPGLFGEVGLTSLLPVPPATLRAVIEALDEVPAEAWRDDMTLGWVYQYWNDPDREALDAKLHDRGKLEPHELASKTQMFTERYMVEWLLHNSLGPTWLAMCRKNGWTAEVEQQGVLQALDERRAEWRKKREAGEVALDALMPIDGPLEEAWKYYVPQPLPEDVVKHAPASVRELKLLDPACGSGHFLVVAFDLLAELYREEARHRGESWSDRQIAEWILERNLHGVDIDPRAVQIAAAAVFLKARTLAKDASPKQVNLVAPALRLSSLDRQDPALLKLERDIELETGIPPQLTRQLMDVLAGVDHLGTLLKVSDAVDRAIEAHRGKFGTAQRQRDLFVQADERVEVRRDDAKQVVLERLNAFLAHHTGEEDLGLRLRSQQLTAGLRFASIVREGQYHLVVANPPYQGTSRMKDAGYIAKHYPRGKSDLYAAFLERGLELCRLGGASAMVTMRSWMFLSGFTGLREHLLQTFDLRIIGDVDRGAFEEIPDEVVATTMTVFRRFTPASGPSFAMQPTPLDDRSRDSNRTARKRSAVLAQVGAVRFESKTLREIEGSPFVYWWSAQQLRQYVETPKLGSTHEIRKGLCTGNNVRFNRFWWEVAFFPRDAVRSPGAPPIHERRRMRWQPTIVGAKGQRWCEPLQQLVRWAWEGLEIRVLAEVSTAAVVPSRSFYFRQGVAFAAIGSTFSGRLHRYSSVFGDKAPSVFGHGLAGVLCLLNSRSAQDVLSALNPTVSFQAGDVRRLPLFTAGAWEAVEARINGSFDEHESGRETSIEFRQPGRSSWEYTQAWAQQAVDLPKGKPPPTFAPSFVDPTAHHSLSYAVGCAFGRFGADASGVLSEAPLHALKNGVLYISARNEGDSLDSRACDDMMRHWTKHAALANSESVREWLRDEFFTHHRELYENRPIYLPLASAKRSFTAFVFIHRWNDSTLSTLLADHLIPERKAIEGALVDLQSARSNPDKKVRAMADKNYVQHKKWLEELEDFIRVVQEIAEKGPPSPDDKTPPREVDVPYRMDLDDGVMVNSAALWPLLEPMWKDPKKWWKELATAKGRKDYDWSHLAARYFPSRVDAKCRKDPSLAVAHGCFWKHHPEKAYQWALRLKDEIGPDFKLDEKDSDALRAAFLEKEAGRARELEAAELARRERKSRKQGQEELDLSEADADESEDEEAASE
ncbi:type II restriction endonuclease [Myxococcus xanthus]|nr:BREX-6 system adenine-specific DNA-methyltransferase PglX [Myxococcus xanthus]QDE82497.1 type II restriction endonuclease [Myxococcus xanthus]